MSEPENRGPDPPRPPLWGFLRAFRRTGPDASYDRTGTGQVKMRQIRSADPWSTFLAPTGRESGQARSRPDLEEGRVRGGGSPRAADADPDPADACRRVINQLNAADGPLTREEIEHRTGLAGAAVEHAVETLRRSGLVTVEREVDEVVRLAAG
ncbi:helix-turn-helix domain-containing protein [Spirillospora sp. CA-253888]